MYGKELIIDLHDCDVNKFNRKDLKRFFIELCKLIDMQRCKLSWWDDVGIDLEDQQSSPHTKGTSAVQFILTSNITVHTLDILKSVYINVFSCKDFNELKAEKFITEFFDGIVIQSLTIKRK